MFIGYKYDKNNNTVPETAFESDVGKAILNKSHIHVSTKPLSWSKNCVEETWLLPVDRNGKHFVFYYSIITHLKNQ